MFGEDDEDNDKLGNTIRPAACGVLSFHSGTEEAMFIYIQNYAQRNDVDGIIKAIDQYCYTRHWMMHIGDQKSLFLEDAIVKTRMSCPGRGEVIVELGSYCGYSSLRIAKLLSEGGRLYSIEKESQCVDWTMRLLDYAGLLHKVTVIHGCIDDNDLTLNKLKDLIIHDSHINPPSIDLLFIDHKKSLYLPDLKHIIASNLLHSGSIVVADNVLCFDEPLHDYLTYVKEGGLFSSSITMHSALEYSSLPPGMDSGAGATTSEPFHLDRVEISVYR